MSTKLPAVEDLANEFLRILKEVLGEEDYAKVVALNSVELNPDVCNSGDFCDSNMVMDAAFRTFGVDPCPDLEEGMTDEVCALWNTAWDRAKAIMIA
ncbi:hypothetical protein P9A47_gp24 [Xanthomonas phage Elanor]|uniref:Uncharacterized protein n=1 Tax=Xanthomonas phage Elanor TaxID=2939127 RepID=A0A9E7E1J2_9CAUD|nr:hypothetical protein P9A47_gp24 [Xanthomonas phage Elanor]URA06992.1 hypothetical protein Elanor_BL40024 [Xanthomonas phage Elanor]